VGALKDVVNEAGHADDGQHSQLRDNLKGVEEFALKLELGKWYIATTCIP